jgi:hypothetical protein
MKSHHVKKCEKGRWGAPEALASTAGASSSVDCWVLTRSAEVACGRRGRDVTDVACWDLHGDVRSPGMGWPEVDTKQ